LPNSERILSVKLKSFLTALLFVSAMIVAVAPPSRAASLTFQGVTFTVATVDANTFSLSMSGLQSASGDWAGIEGIRAFGLKDIGSFAATTLSLTNWTVGNSELSASTSSGCGGPGGGPKAYCFSHNGGTLLFGGLNTLTFNIDHAGVAPNLTSPHLKVLFTGADVPNGHGSLLSQNLASVPVPSTLPLLGGGLMGLAMWRRKAITV
jgi:hypothetical protein